MAILSAEVIALIISAFSLFISFFTLRATAQATKDNAAATEINNFLQIICESEQFAEEIISSPPGSVRNARISRYVNYMEALALFVNEKRFTPLLRRELIELIINFIVIFRREGILDSIYQEANLNDSSFEQLRKIEGEHKNRLNSMLNNIQLHEEETLN